MKLVFVNINKLDGSQSDCTILENVATLREAIMLSFFKKDVDLSSPDVIADATDIESCFVEHPHAFVWDGNEELVQIFFKM